MKKFIFRSLKSVKKTPKRAYVILHIFTKKPLIKPKKVWCSYCQKNHRPTKKVKFERISDVNDPYFCPILGAVQCKNGQINPLYRRWCALMHHCYNPKDTCYRSYGAKNIRICTRWHDFVTFYRDNLREFRSRNMVLVRKNLKKDFAPENCEWVHRCNKYMYVRGI